MCYFQFPLIFYFAKVKRNEYSTTKGCLLSRDFPFVTTVVKLFRENKE